jgi:signal transduction histidine kinase
MAATAERPRPWRSSASSARTIFAAGKIVRRGEVRAHARVYARGVPIPRRADLILAAVVTVVAQLETWLTASLEPRAAYAGAALAMTVPLAWRTVAPLTVLALVFVPLTAMELAGHRLDSGYILLVLIVAFVSVGGVPDRRRAIAGLVLGLALMTGLFALEAEDTFVGDLVFIGGILTAAWVLAVVLRERSDRADRLVVERDERAHEAVAEERARIARELHDVVAHAVSVIAVQSGSLRRRLRHERPADAEELRAIEETAREALADMRRMLGLLRADDDGLALSPQPGLDQVERLVEQVRDTGLPVEVVIEGEPRPLPPGVDLAAYRIVQEALTNVRKHAGPARARIAMRYADRELGLEITDDGRGANFNGDSGGQGLVGMGERVALYGGSFEARPAPGGGFQVRARLPT